MQDTSKSDFCNKLPTEMLDLVLGHLSHGELKLSTKISRNWNMMISNSKVFMDSTKRTFTIEGRSAARCGMKFDRNYSHLSIGQNWWTGVKLDNTHVGALMKFSENVTHIYIEKVIVKKGELKGFLKFLESCEALKELHLVHLKTEFKYPSNRFNASLALSLNKFTVVSSDWVLAHLQCKSLDLLKIVRKLRPPFNEALKPRDPICRFLNTLSKLHELILENVDMNSEEVELTPNFRWNKLRYDDVKSPTFTNDTNCMVNWKNFMGSSNQGAEVNVNFNVVSRSTIQFLNVLTNYSKVTKLGIRSLAEAPLDRDVDQFKTLENNSEIVRLKIEMFIDRERTEHLEGFLSSFPNIYILDLDMDLFKNIKKINELLKHVRHLKITMLHRKNINFVLPNLKILEIRSIFNQDLDLLEIVGKNHPQLSTFRIRNFGNNNFVNNIVFKTLSDLLPNVEQFEIGNSGGMSGITQTRAQILENSHNSSDSD